MSEQERGAQVDGEHPVPGLDVDIVELRPKPIPALATRISIGPSASAPVRAPACTPTALSMSPPTTADRRPSQRTQAATSVAAARSCP